jgi:hypothetical protein
MPIIQAALALSQFAPQIMRFFGAGDASAAAAQKVVDIAQTVTGATSPEAAIAAMREDREQAARFQLATLQADTDLEKAYLADRGDARARDIKLRALTGGTNRRADLMVLLDVVGLIACLIVLARFRSEIPSEVVGLLTTIATAFALCLRDAHQFEFGSSRGSKEKDELLVKQIGG